MNPIGFAKECLTQRRGGQGRGEAAPADKPAVPSVVRIRFPDCGRELDYFNDRFDLRPGNLVFVDGKLAGQRGCVTAVSKHFKIKPEDYKRVIGLADTGVSGQFRSVGSHLVTFDRRALAYSRFRTWVLPPKEDDTAYFVSFGDEEADLRDLHSWPIDPGVAARGAAYYRENRVLYVCLDEGKGKAIVEGTRPYEVDFRCEDSRVTDLSCDCPCGYHCKHEAAVLLQLREILDALRAHCAAEWSRSGYFAAVFAPLFFSMAVDGKCDTVLSIAQAER